MKTPFFIFLLLLSVFTSCQFEHEFAPPDLTEEPQPIPLKLDRIKTQTVNEEISTYFYDAKGNISEYSNTEGYSEKYQYLTGKVIRNDYDEDGDLSRSVTYELNDQGLCIESYNTGNPGAENYWEYNDDQTIHKWTSVNPQGQVFAGTYHYVDGNVDHVVYTRDGAEEYTYHYTYYSIPNNLTEETFGTLYSGKESKNLLKRWKGVAPNGNTFITNLYTYTFDAEDRVISTNTVFRRW